MDSSRIQRYVEELENACEFKSQSPCAQYFEVPVRASYGFRVLTYRLGPLLRQ